MEQSKPKLSEEKTRNLIVAGTVGAVLLVTVLIAVMIYQLISIGVYNKRIKKYEQAIQQYETLIEEGKSQKETYALRWWIEREARELGLVFADDIPLN